MAGFLRVATTAVMLLALTLAALPFSLTLSLAGAGSRTPSSARADTAPSPMPALVRLKPVTLPPLPSPQASPSTHVVTAGETLWEIAQAAGVDVAALAEANHMSEEDTLHPGQVLTVPAPGTPASARPVFAQDVTPQLLWPSRGRITSRFGWRIHPIFGKREFHTGIDIAAGQGTPVRAAEGGIVRFAGWSSGYGRLVTLDHGNGLQTSYSHLSAVLVAVGDRVEAGQVVGRIGSTGWSTGPHLLFEVRRNGVPVDPNRYLR